MKGQAEPFTRDVENWRTKCWYHLPRWDFEHHVSIILTHSEFKFDVQMIWKKNYRRTTPHNTNILNKFNIKFKMKYNIT